MSIEDQGAAGSAPASFEAVPVSSSVGAALRDGRTRLGLDRAAVSQKLKIRQTFIEALEEGRHKDLPGGAYAIGFLRSYADFLSLDGEEMVRRFKQEAVGDLNAHSELQFPSPVSEGRMPTAPVLLIGLAVAVVAYGLWWGIGTRRDSLAQLVPEVPERLASLLRRPVGVSPQDAPVPPPPPAPVPEPVAEAPAPAVAPAPEPAPPPPSPSVADVQPLPVVQPMFVPVVPPPPAPVAAPLPTVVAAPPPVVAAPPPKAIPAPVPQPVATVTAKPVPVVAPEPPAPTVDPSVASAEGRVVLRATSDDCWIQVREGDGQLVVSRLLRRGDSYHVPDRANLTLTVGNAGALEVSVDGQPVAPLGIDKQVLRRVSLDPAKLRH